MQSSCVTFSEKQEDDDVISWGIPQEHLSLVIYQVKQKLTFNQGKYKTFYPLSSPFLIPLFQQFCQ